MNDSGPSTLELCRDIIGGCLMLRPEGRQALTPETHLVDDLNATIMDLADILWRAEWELGLKLDPNEVNETTLATVGDLMRIIEQT
ncbi:MAG: hypothetical protein PHR51_02220 [Patescibacteria group bacterium]|nr:hypothetical protein [Patescibacteria group bacterium]